jgi:serine/threonine protein phosphatase PrpC
MFIIRHELYESDIKKAIFDSFEKINKELSNKAVAEVIPFLIKIIDLLLYFLNVKKFRSGSTACLVILRNNKLHIAWCGDSQCCLIRKDKTFYITEPHKPNNDKEKERIESLGGCVTYNSKDWRVNGVLSVARSFGDVDYQPFVTCLPDYIEIDLCSNDEYLVVGKFNNTHSSVF